MPSVLPVHTPHNFQLGIIYTYWERKRDVRVTQSWTPSLHVPRYQREKVFDYRLLPALCWTPEVRFGRVKYSHLWSIVDSISRLWVTSPARCFLDPIRYGIQDLVVLHTEAVQILLSNRAKASGAYGFRIAYINFQDLSLCLLYSSHRPTLLPNPLFCFA